MEKNKQIKTLKDFREKYSYLDSIQWGNNLTEVSEYVFGIVASNLSDFHIEKNILNDEDMDRRINQVKEIIFDFQSVIRNNS